MAGLRSHHRARGVVAHELVQYGHAISQWQEFTDEQAPHGQSVEIADFLAAFSSTTFENWQLEFLQLFFFVVLAAMPIDRGSAESRDSDDRIEQALQRIEGSLGTAPAPPSRTRTQET